MKRFFKFSQSYLEIAIILLFGLIPLLWFKEGFLAAGHDMSYPLAPIDYFKDRLFTWSDRGSTFGINQTDSINGVFIHGLEALFPFLGFSLIASQQLTFIFWFLLPGLTMYILLRSLFPENKQYIARLGGAAFYMLNHYLLQAWTIAERTKFSIVAALPIVVLLVVNVAYRKHSPVKNALLLALTLFFLNGGAGIPLWGGLFLVAGTVLAVLLLSSRESLGARVLRASVFLGTTAVALFSLNLYWLFSYLGSFSDNFTNRVSSSGGAEGAVAWSRVISLNTSFENLFRLQGIPEWYDNVGHPYANQFLENPFLIALSILFPILAFFGLAALKTHDRFHKTIIFCLLCLLLVSALFSAGSHGITGKIYDFLLTNLPGFSIFRTPIYKFGMALWFAYSILIAYGLLFASKKIQEYLSLRQIRSHLVTPVILGFYLISLGVYNYPFFTGGFFNWSEKYSTMIQVPDYIFESKKELDSNKFTTKTLLLPDVNIGTLYEIYDWRYFSLSTVPSILSRKPVVINDAVLSGPERELVNVMYQDLAKNGSSRLMDYFGVDKILLRKDFVSTGDSQLSYIDYEASLEKNEQVRLSKEVGDWSFYDVSSNKITPKIYSPDKITFFNATPRELFNYLETFPVETSGFLKPIEGTHTTHTLDTNQFSQFVIQGDCINCGTKEPPPIIAKPPKILPGNSLYSLYSFIKNLKRPSFENISKEIDYNLGTTIPKGLALEEVVLLDKKGGEISFVINDISTGIGKVEDLYANATSSDKEINKEKVFYYLQRLEKNIYEARNKTELVNSKQELTELNNTIHETIVRLNVAPNAVNPKEDQKYAFNMPEEGEYLVSLYISDSDMSHGSSIPVSIGSEKYILNKELNDGTFSGNVYFQSGYNIVNLPPYSYVDSAGVKEAKVFAKFGKEECADVSVTPFNGYNYYKLKFNYKTNLPLKVYVDEQRRTGNVLTPLFYTDKAHGEEFNYFEYTYTPGAFSDSAILKFCINGIDPEPSFAEIENIRIIEEPRVAIIYAKSNLKDTSFEVPDIQFTQINQTKYLIKTGAVNSNFVLGFNERFDASWVLREADERHTQEYFNGGTKEYLNGSVLEFEPKDKHTIFPLALLSEPFTETPNHFMLNGIFNGWFLDPGEEKVYILEYNKQNGVYLFALASGAVFLFILCALAVLYIYAKKSN